MADRYECDECGACCRHLIVEIEWYDITREPRLVGNCMPFKNYGKEIPQAIPGHGAGATLVGSDPCPFLGSDNRCGIYPSRPHVCLTFPAGGKQCQDARKSAGLEPLKPVQESTP